MSTSVAHPRDVMAWHGLSGLCMVLMLAAAVPAWLAGAGLAVFAVGVGWCAVQAARQVSPAAYLRLAVCCLAMLVMLIPSAAAPGSMTGSMTGHGMVDQTPGAPSWLASGLAVALLVLVLAGGRRLSRAALPGASRVGAGCEVVLAAAMAAILVGLL